MLEAKHEDDPQSLIHDRFSVALVNIHQFTVGHLLKFTSKLAHFFIKHDGHSCKMTGYRRYSADLEQGGLEIPATIIFWNKNEKIVEQMKKRFNRLSMNITRLGKTNDHFSIF